MRPSGVITLLTDFGTRDAYVASMKGVILAVQPRATIVDVTHEVVAGDLEEAAWLLGAAYGYFPAGTVHVAVVDPGVGGPRRAIAARAGDWYFVAPDNGVLTLALRRHAEAEVRAIENRAYLRPEVSATFHGRDVFAPAAAHLASGAPLETFGARIEEPVLLRLPEPRVEGGAIACEVVRVDRFGNLITDLDEATLRAWRGAPAASVTVEAGGRRIEGIAATYGDVAPSAPLAYAGSSGYLEIAVRDGSAAAALGIGKGAPVVLRRGR